MPTEPTPPASIFDAIVLCGGRSSRLGGESKASLVLDGATLLHRAVEAVRMARRVAVVGDPDALDLTVRLDERLLLTREQPAFAGPAAAVATGHRLLEVVGEPSVATVVLACDIPRAASAVLELLDALPADADGVVAVDERGRRQHLLAVYRTSALSAAIGERDLVGASMRDLTTDLDLREVPVPEGSAADVDTWDDAAALGVKRPAPAAEPDSALSAAVAAALVESSAPTSPEAAASAAATSDAIAPGSTIPAPTSEETTA